MRMTSGDPSEHSNNQETPSDNGSSPGYEVEDEQLRIAMEMSRKQQEEDDRRRQQEDEELELILKLSLTDK